MDKEDAKLILAGRGLGQGDPQDADYRAALAVVEADPELAAWWIATQKEDDALRDKFVSFPAPSDLKASLRASLAKPPAKPKSGRRVLNWLALAACLALVAQVYFGYIVDRSDDYRGPLEKIALAYSIDGPRLTFMDKSPSRLKSWLASQGIDLPPDLPPRLLEQEGIGCRPLEWTPGRVALLCFNAETVYHFFVGQADEHEELVASQQIAYAAPEKDWTVSSWKTDSHVFVLTAKTSQAEMRKMLASYAP